jgi:hypothetical protein
MVSVFTIAISSLGAHDRDTHPTKISAYIVKVVEFEGGKPMHHTTTHLTLTGQKSSSCATCLKFMRDLLHSLMFSVVLAASYGMLQQRRQAFCFGS